MSVKTLRVLGIESSCDETACAILERSVEGKGKILAQVVASQFKAHQAYGGVVPEIAARAHIRVCDKLVSQVMAEANLEFSDLDGVAATAGPGLVGGLLVGLTTAKAISLAAGIPLLGINHLEGHALTPGLSHNLQPPFLLLLISGGHTQLIAVNDVGDYTLYGTSLDDALGEAFDKTAKLLKLGMPGGPHVEQAAQKGDALRFNFPRPLKGREGQDFSFSGLKTAVRREVLLLETVQTQDIYDICASFQAAVSDVLSDRVNSAMERYSREYGGDLNKCLVVAGGVAANHHIRGALTDLCLDKGFDFVAPPLSLCTDNGAMIAWAGLERLSRGLVSGLNTSVRARWPLEEAGDSFVKSE